MGLKDILPVEKIYDDLLSPSVKQVGLALESVFKTARFSVAPFDMAAALYDNRWQKFIKRISDKVEPQNIVEGQPQIVIPVLNALDLQQEDSLLSELFINLLSASIDKTKLDLAHPAFPNILSQLSHDEAVILFHLKKQDYTVETSDITNGVFITKSEVKDFKETLPLANLSFPSQLNLYINHLVSLNLIVYSKVVNERKMFFNYTKRTIISRQLSPFGKLFSDACIPDEFEGL